MPGKPSNDLETQVALNASGRSLSNTCWIKSGRKSSIKHDADSKASAGYINKFLASPVTYDEAWPLSLYLRY